MLKKTTFHFPLSILVGEGKLILDAATAHPELGKRFKAGFLTGAGTLLATVKQQGHRPETETRRCRHVAGPLTSSRHLISASSGGGEATGSPVSGW